MALSRQEFDSKIERYNLNEQQKSTLRNKYYREVVQPSLKGVPRAQREPVFEQWGRGRGNTPRLDVDANPFTVAPKAFHRELVDSTITGQGVRALAGTGKDDLFGNELVAQGGAAGLAEILGRGAAQLADPVGNLIGGAAGKAAGQAVKRAPALAAGITAGATQGGAMAGLEGYNQGEINWGDVATRAALGGAVGGAVAKAGNIGNKKLQLRPAKPAEGYLPKVDAPEGAPLTMQEAQARAFRAQQDAKLAQATPRIPDTTDATKATHIVMDGNAPMPVRVTGQSDGGVDYIKPDGNIGWADSSKVIPIEAARAARAADPTPPGFLNPTPPAAQVGDDLLTPFRPEQPQQGTSPIARLMSDESGQASPTFPAEAAAGAVRGVGTAIRKADEAVDTTLRNVGGKVTEGVAGVVNKVAGRPIARGGLDPVTGEDRLGQQLAEVYDRAREPVRKAIMGEKPGDDYRLLKRQHEGAGSAIAREGETVAQAIRKELTPEQNEELYRVLNNRDLTDTSLRNVSEPVRQRINELSQEMYELGSLNEAQFTANQGQYLRRLYEKHLNESASIKRIVSTATKGLKGSKYRGKRQVMDEATFQQVARPWQKVADTPDGSVRIRDASNGEELIVDARDAGEYLGEWRSLGNRKGGEVIAWRDWTPEERTNMGEVKDAALALEATLKQAARDIRNGRILRDVARNRDMSVPADEVTPELMEAGWIHLANERNASGRPRWGPLSDHYVRPDIAQDLQMTKRLQEEFKTWRTLMAFWKKGKTVYNPASHLNNFMQNTIALELNGGSLADLPAAANIIREKGVPYQNLEAAGLFDNTYAMTELADAITRAPDASQTGLIAHFLRGAQKLDEKATNAYQGADDLFRIALVLGKMREGMPSQQAIDMARTRLYHGDINSPALDAMSQTIFPFIKPVAWTVAEVPKMALRNPAKVAKLGLYYLLWNQASQFLNGQSSEQVKAQQTLLPDYLQGPGKVAQFPLRDTKGQPLILNTSNWNPAGVADPMERSAIPFLPQALDPGGPLRTAANLASNYDGFRQRPIRDPATSAEQQAWDVARYVTQELAPTQVFSNAWKVVDAARGVPDYGGRQYDVPTALANVIGIKLQPMDAQKAYEKMATRYEREIQDAKRVISQAAREYRRDGDRGKYDRVYNAQVDLIRQKVQELQQKLKEARPALEGQP